MLLGGCQPSVKLGGDAYSFKSITLSGHVIKLKETFLHCIFVMTGFFLMQKEHWRILYFLDIGNKAISPSSWAVVSCVSPFCRSSVQSWGKYTLETTQRQIVRSQNLTKGHRNVVDETTYSSLSKQCEFKVNGTQVLSSFLRFCSVFCWRIIKY